MISSVLKSILTATLCVIVVLSGVSRQDPTQEGLQNNSINYREDCVPTQAKTYLAINNVRAVLQVGGDVWTDSQVGQYIVPAPKPGSDDPELSSIYAGGVWLGGYDNNGNLKLAASTYRSTGIDYYAGPLDSTGETDLEICNQWDRFFEVTKDDADIAFAVYNEGEEIDCDKIPESLKRWPAIGNPFFTDYYPFDLPETADELAPFWDDDGDGLYNPCSGDFPIIDIRGCYPENRSSAQKRVAGQMIFWIYNDNGGTHSLTDATSMNMEVQVQAFAFQRNDELNDMTFMRYKLLNRGQTDLINTYFAMWVDPDLGCSADDYIGCDVERSLAYTYNADAEDGDNGINCSDAGVSVTYGTEIPIIGTDYFRGPLAPKVFSIGEDGGTILVDPDPEQPFDTLVELGMSSFMYYNRGDLAPEPGTGEPSQAIQYYNLLSGRWIDSTALTYGGTGYNPASIEEVKYAFPSTPNNIGADAWSMCSEGLAPGDRRTLQASGPFTLFKGVKNELIVGVVWVPNLNYPCPDISRIQKADDLAQATFDNCFELVEGPDSPDVSIVELDQELILVLSNDSLSNNANLGYSEKDLFAPEGIDANYVFEGYRVYQLINANVSVSEFDDIEKAVEIATIDLKNGITRMYNWDSFKDPNDAEGTYYLIEDAIETTDSGIKTTIKVTEDRFATGDTRLKNHTKYYFAAVAFAHNNYETFNPGTGLGQQKQYLEGGEIRSYVGTPRPIVYENLNSAYGDGAVVKRLDGVGNPGVFLDLEDGMHDKILANNQYDSLVYKKGAGPVNVKVYNPLEVVDGTYQLRIDGELNNTTCNLNPGATWTLTNVDTGEEYKSSTSIDINTEQVIPGLGISLDISQVEEAGSNTDKTNGVIDAKLDYSNPNDVNWFDAYTDNDTRWNDVNGDGNPDLVGFDRVFNFISTELDQEDNKYDENQAFSSVGDGYFYPFLLTDGTSRSGQFIPVHLTPAYHNNGLHNFLRANGVNLDRMNNVDIVFTSDKSKWSRCVVVETATDDYTPALNTVDGTLMFNLRTGQSVNKDGLPDDDDAQTTGMSWFPGYAVDVETGKRLNIFFGENSVFNEEFIQETPIEGGAIGADMLWNPTDQVLNSIPQNIPQDLSWLLASGGHFLYVTNTEYDGCAELEQVLRSKDLSRVTPALISVTWCSMTKAARGTSLLSYADGVVPNDLTVKLRVDNPYNYERVRDLQNNTSCVTEGGLPTYQFEIRNQAPVEIAESEYEDVLKNIRAVPNPYYGYDDYESNAFNTRIKITNLPARSQITIYTLDGKFVKQFNRDEVVMTRENTDAVQNTQINPDVEWDLKNYAGIPVASGVYLIHVNALDYGKETTIKWFGVNRKFNPTGL